MSPHHSWHRSLNNRVFAGVCGGLSETWGTDPNLIRLFWVLFVLWTRGAGIILYFVAALLLPVGDRNSGREAEQDPVIDVESPANDGQKAESYPKNQEQESNLTGSWKTNRRTQQWIGLMLMLVGGYWLLERFLPNIADEVHKVALPLILIALGLWLVLRERRGEGD
ncbi:MAG TPA: PspC domain-containing protein [Bacillota bacterium]|nr:PspC domain-containing protein [Bacillota bacterium]